MNKTTKDSFRTIIRREYIKAALIPIMIIEVMLLILYFSINFYKDNKAKETLLKEAKVNLSEISKLETEKINLELKQISQFARILQSENQRFFEQPDRYPLPAEPPILKIAANGSMYKENDNGGSSIYYSNLIPFTSKSFTKAIQTEALDPLFKEIKELDSNIVAVYLNTYDNMNRYYPFIEKTYEQFEPGLNIPSFNFYYEADAIHNPSRGVVWTEAYLDPAGKGWMASCIVPIYNGDFLEGVAGIDITIENFIKHILRLKIPWEGMAFLVSKTGDILAMPPKVEQIIGISELKSHTYAETVKKNTFKPESFNLLKNPETSQIFKDFLHSKEFLEESQIKGHDFLLSKYPVEETGWLMVTMVDKDILYAPIYSLHKLGILLGIIAIFFLILFYAAFFIFLTKRAKKVANDLSSPLDYVIITTSTIISDKPPTLLNPVGIIEIDHLLENFNRMMQKLRSVYDEQEMKIAEGVRQLREKDHMLITQSRQAAMGEMIGNIAHQWRQPLTSIAMMIQNIQDAAKYGELDKKYLDEKIKRIMEVISYMSKTIDDFRNFFKPSNGKQAFNICDTLDYALSFIRPSFVHNNILIETQCDKNVVLEGYPNEFAQVLLNILNNAKEVLVERGIGQPRVYIHLKKTFDKITLAIGDNGGGIDPDILDKIFEPYFTTKEMGTGLGLYMSKMIIEKNMNGKLYAQNTSDGTEFIIELYE